MAQYIDKDALVAEIEKEKKEYAIAFSNMAFKSHEEWLKEKGKYRKLLDILSFLDTLEVKEANEALRTEYEKGGADVIADTLSWLENCWPKYCSNQTIIEGFKEAIKE